jgi:hypothetical protein
MGVKNSALVDLIATTLNDLPDQQFEVMWDNQDYEFCRIYQNERMEIDGGNQIERKVMLDPTGNARYRRLYDTDTPAVGEVMHTIKVPWTQLGTNYSWDKVEIMRNKNSAKGFVNLLKTRRVDGLWDLANLIEDRAWKTPDSANDDINPYGVPYYLNFFTDASGTVNSSAGFNGVAAKYQNGNFTANIAGIDASEEPKWRNYCAPYTKVDNSMLKAFRIAFMKTRFKVPLLINDPSNARVAAKRIYTDSTTVAELMEFADLKDDNHTGKDVLGNLKVDDGGLCFINRLPVVFIPQLEGADYSPIYCIDFAKFIPYVQDGYWMDEGEPITDRTQHTVFTVFLDGAHNNLCINRRTAGFVMHKTTA